MTSAVALSCSARLHVMEPAGRGRWRDKKTHLSTALATTNTCQGPPRCPHALPSRPLTDGVRVGSEPHNLDLVGNLELLQLHRKGLCQEVARPVLLRTRTHTRHGGPASHAPPHEGPQRAPWPARRAGPGKRLCTRARRIAAEGRAAHRLLERGGVVLDNLLHAEVRGEHHVLACAGHQGPRRKQAAGRGEALAPEELF